MSGANNDIVGLPLWTRPASDEPVHGLFLRLASINGFASSSDVMRSTGLTLARLRYGKDVAQLAGLIRCEEAVLAANSFRFVKGEKVTIRGETVNLRRDLLRKARRACPRCVAESPHHRFWWDLAFFGTCPHHAVRLIDHCSCSSGRKLTWQDGSIRNCYRCEGGDVARIACEPAPAEEVRADRYVLGRLGTGVPETVPVLDALPVAEVVDMLDRVGSFSIGGFSKTWVTASRLGRSGGEVRAEGFRVLADNRMEELLERSYREFLAASPDEAPGLANAYGWFYHWLNGKGGKAYSPILSNIILQTADLQFVVSQAGRDDRLPPQPYYTLVEAAKVCGVNQQTVRRILDQFDMVRDVRVKGRRIQLDRKRIDEIAATLKAGCDLAEVAAMLGTVGPRARAFAEAGLIAPIVQGGGNTHRYAFDRAAIQAFLDQLGAGVPMIDTCPDNALPVQQACHGFAVPLTVLCRAVLDGTTRFAGRLKGKTTLEQFVIDKTEILGLRRRFRAEREVARETLNILEAAA